jgi:hypothetical protein
MDEVSGTFDLAMLATEALHGADRVALEALYKVDPDSRTVEVDRSTGVGGTLAVVFLGYCRREFGSESFRMKRVRGAGAAAEGEVL